MADAYLLDFSFSRPTPADVISARETSGYNIIGGISYVSLNPEKNWNGINSDGTMQRPGEVESWLAAGLSVGFVWETWGIMTGGYGAGKNFAQQALTEMASYPPEVACYFADDANNSWSDVSAAFQAIIDLVPESRPAGCYGSYDVCNNFINSGGQKAWQVQTWSPGYNTISSLAHLCQMPNLNSPIPGTDLNLILQPNWGGYSTQEDDVLTPDEHNAIIFTGQVLQEWKDTITAGGGGDYTTGLKKLEAAIGAVKLS